MPPEAPLAGMKVVDLCRLLPGDFTTWILVDLGAEVIKIEDLGGGDYMRWMPPMVGHSSAMYRSINRGKRSIRLDLKAEDGRAIFRRLMKGADALVESFRPGVMDRLGLGYQSLSDEYPELVYCAITGYGQDGPYAARAGHDLDYIALAGLQGVTGVADGELAIPGFQVADLAGGGLTGALAVVSALLARERDPARRGTFLDVSMFDGVAALMAPHLARHMTDPEADGPAEMHLNGRYPCYHLYRSEDGRWMALAALEPKFWEAFCELVGRPDLVDRQFEDGPGVAGEVAEIMRGRDRADWIAAARGRDVCLEPVNNLDEALADPHFQARGLQLQVDGSSQPAPLVRLPGAPRPDTRVAAQGEDTAAVLAELGYGTDEVEGFRAAGII